MDEGLQGAAQGVAQGSARGEAGQAKAVMLYRPAIVSLLYMLNIFLGFSVFVGVILAYVWRGDGETQEWEKTHYTYLIRTFWIGLVVMVAVFVLWMGTFIGVVASQAGQNEPPPPWFFLVIFGVIPLWLLSAAWFFTRCILSMVRAGICQPMPKPKTWLF